MQQNLTIWIKPLLDSNEFELYLNHTRPAPDGDFELYDVAQYNARWRQETLRKLNGLAYMFELLVKAGVIE